LIQHFKRSFPSYNIIMSSKRKKSSLSQSSQSGSEASDPGKDLAKKKLKGNDSSSGSSDEGSGSGSSSDSGTARSRSGSKSRSASPASSKGSPAGSDSGTEGSGGGAKKSDTNRKGSGSSGSGNNSSDSGKSKKLMKASKRKPSSNMVTSTLSQESDSEEEGEKQRDSRRRKKSGSSGRSNAGSSEDGEESWEKFDDGFDEDLIGDDEDRQRLEEMTEREREEELFKRAEKREEMKKRFEITKKLKLQQKNKKDKDDENIEENSGSDEKTYNQLENNIGPASRKKNYEEKYDKKFSALNELKAKREEKERKERERKLKESSKSNKNKSKNLSESESGSDLEKLGKKNSSSKKKILKASDIYSSSSDEDGKGEDRRKSSSSSSSSSSSVSSISSGESDTERQKSKKVVKKARSIETVEELERIRLSRYKLEKFVHLPIFKRTVVGCFVRIGIGKNNVENKPVYRVAEITEVCETAKTYSVGKSRTNVGFRLRISKDERVFRAEFVSNQKYTESEFFWWKNKCEDDHVELPNVQCIDNKANDIEKALNYRFSSMDVDKILASKEKFVKHPVNYAVYKTKLLKDKIQAQDMGQDEEVEKVTKQLEQLEERAEELDKKRTASISTISLINDRNRKANVVKAEKAIMEEVRRAKIEGQKDDPFTRRKSRPKLPTAKKETDGDEMVMTSELLLKLEQDKKKVEDIKVEEKTVKKLPKALEVKIPKALTEKPVFKNDLFDAHDFDVEVNVNEIQDMSVPVSINLKPVTTSTPASTGPTKRSLKIDEWKKKRGII